MTRICRTLFPVCGLAVLLTSPQAWSQETTAKPRLQLMDVFELEFAAEPQVSPDGRHVAYLRNSMDVMRDRVRTNLWIVGADGKGHRPLVSGEMNVSSPRWSSNGDRLAYVVMDTDAEGKPKKSAQIYCRWMDSGQTAVLSQLPMAPGNLVWSPDGNQIAFSMFKPQEQEPLVKLPSKPSGAKWAPEPKVIRRLVYRRDGAGYRPHGFTHLFVIPAEGGTPRQITDGDFDHSGPPVWTPDNQALLFAANRRADAEYDPRNTEIFEARLEASNDDENRIRALTDRQGPDDAPAISPDGKKIAFVGFDDRRQGHQTTRLYVMNRDGGRPHTVLKSFDRDVQLPVWDHSGQQIYFQYDDQGVTKIGAANLQGEVRTVAENVGGVTLGRPYASGSFTVSAHGAVAFTQTNPWSPADVAFISAKSRSPRRLTSLNADLFDHRTLGAVEKFHCKSSFDQQKIHGWIVKPPSFDASKKNPLVLEIHGGPFANYGPRFSAEVQLYAAAGYVVVYVNPRGSTSYGEKFANSIHHAYPGRDYDDLMSAVDAVIEQGFIDRERLFVTGGSGGGVLTAWIVGKTDRFRAAVAAKPVINWYSFLLTTDMHGYFARNWFPGFPWDHAEHYHQRSPLSLVGNVKTPTMLLTGEADHRTPMSESEQFYQALKLRKVDTLLVRVPGASHNIAQRPSNLARKVAHVLKWFEMHDE